MVGSWLSTVPSLVYSFFAGSLSDDYGRLPCIKFPLIGVIIGNFASIINYFWIDKLPIEFFYICGGFFYSILGGNAVYYLGIYGFGANITQESNRFDVIQKDLKFNLERKNSKRIRKEFEKYEKKIQKN